MEDMDPDFENGDTLIVLVGEPSLFPVDVQVPGGTSAGNYVFSLTVTDYHDSGHVSVMWFTINVFLFLDIRSSRVNNLYFLPNLA